MMWAEKTVSIFNTIQINSQFTIHSPCPAGHYETTFHYGSRLRIGEYRRNPQSALFILIPVFKATPHQNPAYNPRHFPDLGFVIAVYWN